MATGNKSKATKANMIIWRVAKLLASLLLIGLTSACFFLPIYDDDPDAIPVHAQLSLSPDGSRLVVSWNDRSRKLLDVETLDLVQLHCPPTPVYSNDEVFDIVSTRSARK